MVTKNLMLIVRLFSGSVDTRILCATWTGHQERVDASAGRAAKSGEAAGSEKVVAGGPIAAGVRQCPDEVSSIFMDPETTRVRLHWANGRVTELSASSKATIIRLPTGEGMRSFRATEDIDDDGFDVFVEEIELPPVAD
jgi:hypothetical protein